MNAPLSPSLLALPQEVRELVLRVVEAALLDASIAARGDTASMRQRGHYSAAEAHETAARAVQRISAHKLVAEFAPQAPDLSEQAAFEAAAKAAHFNTLRNQVGDFSHPLTWRAHTIWLAALRWARNQPDRPP